MSVDAYRRELAAVLDGKDPRVANVSPGSAVFVFADEGTITVQIHKSRVAVVDGGQSLEGLPTVLVRASLRDWLAYCEAPDADRASAIEVYGEDRVLADVGALMEAKLSSLGVRFLRGG
jgi:hypothetical protein